MALLQRLVAPSSRGALRQSPAIALMITRRASNMAPPKLKDPSLLKQDVCYVNGEWVKAKSGKTFKVNDPSNGELIGTCPEFNAEDTQSAIRAAADAFPSFRSKTGRERSKLLRAWYEQMTANAEDIAKLITWENGKPIADAKGETTYAANFLEWFSEEAPRVYGDTIPSSVPGNRVWTIKEPVGVCGLITPWNFPAAMITRKIGPALAAGCTVVCKAPAETPFTSLALAELAHRAGIPKGVVNVVTSMENTPELGELLTSDPTIKKISFTGSTGVGKLLMKQSSGTLKKLSMELGGNAPFIVFDDADVDAAVAGAISSKFRSSGQTCVCANRIYVQRGIYDEFVKKFTEKVKTFSVGNGFEQGVTHGPLIHDRAVQKAEDHVKDAEKKGGKVTIGGQRLNDLGSNFYAPTVIRDMTSDMDMASQETFGPVAGLFPFETEEEVVRMANNTEVGLAGYFFSRDLERVHRIAEALEVGMVGVNTGIISDPAAPFGGVKESGFGREGSLYGISEYQITKMITYGGMGKALQHLNHIFVHLRGCEAVSVTVLVSRKGIPCKAVPRRVKPATDLTSKLRNSTSTDTDFPHSTVLRSIQETMALSRAHGPVRNCLRQLASSLQTLSRRPIASIAAAQPLPRCFSSSPALLKKRKIAAASNSPNPKAAAGTVNKAEYDTEAGSGAQPNPEDPLDFSSVVAAYAPIDAHFKTQLAGMVHGGRFNPTNLGSLPVAVKDPEAGDGSFPLRELAQVVPRSGRTISLLVHDKAYIKPIMSAVQSSREFNQQPQRSEDNELELLLKVELERKDDVVRRIKEAVQLWKDRIRQARSKHEKVLKDWKKTGAVLPDVVKKAEKELQKVQDKKMKEIDQEEAQTIRQL
ncbi:Aldehyde/histidinol dehydrogenase [Fusarium solani]|uniref:Succinate-semialdehyde dehydrogenase, mitochondrial n=1 Tax=Fusarium solani TaxID=169388 RepID=A0A9P9L439_FUSSL|nr:Aldehyde/histidinol dehydrogenase [Fusarium solani]KAH7273618.1 Aldehyde/histidinol dehydrogenase [Fusarium solani]